MALNDTDEILAVKAAELYYEAGKTQDEIGLALSVSRWKVGRLLVAARENGFVRIEIVHPSARRFSLERELCGFYDLADAVVVPATDSESDVQGRVAQAAADYLTTYRPVPRTLGVSWGRTLHAVAARLRPGWAVGVNPVQINGSVSSTRQATAAADTAVVIARKAQGTATLLPSPAIFEQAATRRAIEADRSVQSVLELARNASAYLFSAGVVDDSSVHVDSGYLTPDDVASLAAQGRGRRRGRPVHHRERAGRRRGARQQNPRHLARRTPRRANEHRRHRRGDEARRRARRGVERALHHPHHR